MRVGVDDTLCQGHTLCAMSAPDIFVLDDDDGHSRAPDPQVPADREAAVRIAFDSCPERAIMIEV